MHSITSDAGFWAAKQPTAGGQGGFGSILPDCGETRPQQLWEMFLADAQGVQPLCMLDEDRSDDDTNEPAARAVPYTEIASRGTDTTSDNDAAEEAHLGDDPAAKAGINAPAVFAFLQPAAAQPVSLPDFNGLTAPALSADALPPVHNTLPVSLPLFVPKSSAPVVIIPKDTQHTTQPAMPLNGGEIPGLKGPEPSSVPLILPPPIIAHAPRQPETAPTAPLPQAPAPSPAAVAAQTAVAALPEDTRPAVPQPAIITEIASLPNRPATEVHTILQTGLPRATTFIHPPTDINTPVAAGQMIPSAPVSAPAGDAAFVPMENVPVSGVLTTVSPGGVSGGEQIAELNVSRTPALSPAVSAIPSPPAAVTDAVITSTPAAMPAEQQPAFEADSSPTRPVTIAPGSPPALPVFLPGRPTAATSPGDAPIATTTPPAAPELPVARPAPIPLTFTPTAPVISGDTVVAGGIADTAFSVKSPPVDAGVVAEKLVQALKAAVEGLSQELAEGNILSPAPRDVMPQGTATAPALGHDTSLGDSAMRPPVQAPLLFAHPTTVATDTMPAFPAESVARIPRTDLPDESRGLFRELSVELDPPELGRMLVRVTETRGRLAAAVTVEQVSARIAVEQVESHVRQVLGRQGVEIGSFEVSCRGDDAFASPHPFGRSAHPAGADTTLGLPHDPQDRTPAANTAVHHGQIDIYA